MGFYTFSTSPTLIGLGVLLKFAGKDGTEGFEAANHPAGVAALKETYQIGRVKPGTRPVVEEKKTVNKALVLIIGIVIGILY